ncbi:S8 family peptidase [Streptomyces sp. cmx-10-25]|uniref:S8 family peptidase n=1 Tax=Streptomyces sp. cmx-10-25 TaxID=2790919 RepID=UPI00398139C4
MHRSRSSRLRRLAATAVVAASLASLPGFVPVAGAVGGQEGSAVVPPEASQSTSSTITLVTGDTVEVAVGAGGDRSVRFTGAPGTDKKFTHMSGENGDLYVIPEDASDALASGALDRELFNVTRLVRDGYADAAAGSLPVIVAYGDKPSDAALTRRADALPGARRGALVESVDMAGVRVDKREARRFWQAVRPATVSAAGGRTTAATSVPQVAKVWYDAKVKTSLDVSVPQIGAPDAWAEGVDGKGVKVAVLDTGIDLNHADVKDRVVAQQSFVPDVTSVQDGHGHGTHVASTVAGSGADSGGKFKGVAPGADLMVGKVLNDGGGGDFSWVMNGMEWAVAQGADIVNMSLGGTATAPDDPITETVERLTATTGTLFVVAAGNAGPGRTTIGTPGTADSALTVGAVDRRDALASFSSRGPRTGDSAIKPEITAPGVGIVAARAAGTSMGTPYDAHYTAANGTSMATPHVAGAAALLKQRHPDWDGPRIKDALTAHAETAAYTVYQQGNGRLDVSAALDPDLEVRGSADYGLVKWREGTHDTLTRTVTVTTGTDSATTVTPSVSGDFAAGAVTVSGPVAVTAGGTAQVTVTFDPNKAAVGEGSGHLVLTSAGGASAHTAIGYEKEPKRHHLKITFKDRRGGTPHSMRFLANRLEDGTGFVADAGAPRTLDYALPPGHYTLTGHLATAGINLSSTTYADDLFHVPSVDLSEGDAELVIDGTKARDFDLDVTDETRPLEESTYSYQLTRPIPGTKKAQVFGIAGLASVREEHNGAIPVAATEGELYASFLQSKREPLVRAVVTGNDTYALTARTSSYMERFHGKASYEVVDVGRGTPEELAAVDLKGKAALLHLDRLSGASAPVRAVEAAGAAAIVLAPTSDSTQLTVVLGVKVPYFSVPYAEGVRLTADVAAGRTTVAVSGVEESGYHYAGQVDYDDGVPADLSLETVRADYAKLRTAYHSDGTGRIGYHVTNAWGPYTMTSFQTGQFLHQGAERDDYVLARPTDRYATALTLNTVGGGSLTEKARIHRPGTSTARDWSGPVQHPSAQTDLTCPFCRTDKGTVFSPSLGGDGDAGHYLRSGLNRGWTFYRDGRQYPNTSVMVPEKARYTFVSTTTRTADSQGLVLGGKVVTAYTFDSQAATTKQVKDCELTARGATVCEVPPVVQLDYRLDTSLMNEVRAGVPYSVVVDGSRAPGHTGGAEMAGAAFSVSFDGGETWKAADVNRIDENSFKASFRHPALADTDGFVSVRAEVWDAAGDRTVQTVTRAYALK